MIRLLESFEADLNGVFLALVWFERNGKAVSLIKFEYIFLSIFYSSVQFARMPKQVVPLANGREGIPGPVCVSTSIFQIQPAFRPLNSPGKRPNDLITTLAFLSSLCQ